MLQNINTAIDTIQDAKSQFVKTFITNEEIAKPLNTFIAAQSTFAKGVVAETTKFFTSLGVAAYNFDAKKAYATK